MAKSSVTKNPLTKHKHRSPEELIKDNKELREENEKLKSLVADILRMLGEKI